MTKTKFNQSEEKNDEKTCFVMMPISDADGYPSGHFAEVYTQLIEPAVLAAGYKCELATSTSSAHMIQLEVVTKVATADLCICDLSTNNPNVLFEYGIRQAFDLPTVLIKDDKTRRIFDLSGFRDIEYDHNLRIATTLKTRDAIATAIAHTVDGANDETQIFSLVKLMKLTKAALPTGEVTQETARFALLEKKIDGLASLLSSTNHARPNYRVPSSTVKFKGISGEHEVLFDEDAVTVLDMEQKLAESYDSMHALEKSSFWKTLGEGGRIELKKFIAKRSPGFIPF